MAWSVRVCSRDGSMSAVAAAARGFSNMTDRYAPTRALQQAIRGRETEVLEALGIPWQDGAPHIRCPYPDHDDQHPSWRWDEHKDRAHCTCIGRHSILEVVMHLERLEFEAAKLRVAGILGART
jgi:hypothetical protein